MDADHPRDSTPPRVHKAASGDLPEEAPSPGLRDGPVISELLRPAASASDITRLPEPADPHKFAEKPHADTGATFPRRPPTVPEDGDAPCTAERVAFFDLDLTLLDINTGRSWVEKEFKEGKVPLQVFLLAMFWFAKYAAGLGVDASEVACEAMALYKGACSAQMAKEVETWWEDNCVFRLRPKARRPPASRLTPARLLKLLYSVDALGSWGWRAPSDRRWCSMFTIPAARCCDRRGRLSRCTRRGGSAACCAQPAGSTW